MNKEERLKIFILLLLIAFLYWRISVLVFYNDRGMGFLRETTGLNIHHYHYGIIFILIAALIMIFHKINGLLINITFLNRQYNIFLKYFLRLRSEEFLIP